MRLIAAAAIALSLGSACASRRTGLPEATLAIRTRHGLVTVRVEVARTEAARETGLMHRRHLAPDAGMVFPFPEPTTVGFWMRDTLIPLSIAFWDRTGRIVAMLDMRPCRTATCPLYEPHVLYVGALEVNTGFFAREGVRVGDRVRLGGPLPEGSR